MTGVRKKIHLHIGVPKTGTTSIQRALHECSDQLAALGIGVYEGAELASNHVELHMAAMRDGRSSPIKQHLGIVADAAYRASVADRVAGWLAAARVETAVFTAEGLSLLRFPDEIAFLAGLFAGHEVRVHLFLRDRASFLASWRRQLEQTGIALSSDPESFAYVENDSWLADWDSLVAVYAGGFGAGNICVRKYEDEIARPGGVVPRFLADLGVPPGGIVLPRRYWLNRRK